MLLGSAIDLKRGISVLENLSLCVSIYIWWWNGMRLDYRCLIRNLESQEDSYSSMRHTTVMRRWNNLRQQWVDYTEKVSV